MAEAAVAGTAGGERERALRITKTGAAPAGPARTNPLRAAWFWVQRSR